MLADPVLRYADIQACCACLGFREDNVYKIDADAEASIRALLRYLRNEGPDCDVRRELGRLKIVSSDLIPLLCSCTNENKILTELAIRLLMNLTQPALVCFRQEIPKDRDLYGAYAQVDDLLKSYKKDFANEELFRMLHNLVGELLDRKWEERSEEDRLLIERILILVRNVLHIAPDPLEEKRTDEDVSVHDQLIWAMHLSGWDELLLFLGNSEDEQTFVFHTLEIISLMLRQQTPDILASAGDNSKEASKMNDAPYLHAAFMFTHFHTPRSNRFGGTYELLSTPSLSERPLIYHHDITPSLDVNCSGQKAVDSHSHREIMETEVGLVDLDVDKRTFRKPRNRKPVIERSVHRRSILAVQLYLQKFCWQFLQYCYNLLMRTAKASLTRQATQENDETYYLWAMRFFMAFCRVYKFRSEYLSETLNAATFHWIYDQVMHYREVVFSDKRGGGTNRRALQASRRLELAVAAYREFLTCVERMFRVTASDRVPDISAGETQEAVEERLRIQSTAAESIMANVFYVSEYQEVYPMLIKDFNEAIQSREHLRNLVEGSHLFISLLAERLKSGTQTLFVRRRRVVRRRRARRAKPVKRRTTEEEEDNDTPEVRKLRLEYQWSNQLVQPLIDGLERPTDTNSQENEDPEESRLFDATSGGSEARQLRSAIRRVQSALFAGEALTALRLALRLWRLWPEVAPISVDENDPVLSDDRTAGLNPSQLAILGALRQIHSTEFEGTFLLRSLRTICLSFILLADCASNPRTTNTAVIHIMHRLAVRQKLTGSFFQLRLFYIFQQFLRNRSLSGSSEFKKTAFIRQLRTFRLCLWKVIAVCAISSLSITLI
ncbi:timeless protein [Opisthorchis viverrini]|uniref:Timeless protein n=1 Tax=Opisthorchis viverrini TaxID=6198 RepID=A0A1S8WVM7_OPIVI|nr:timeless protein [Opisthorchis viverrini]